MPTHHFTLIVEGADLQDESVLDRLHEAGCDDALVGRVDGVQFIDFDRDAANRDAAISSAVADVQTAMASYARSCGHCGGLGWLHGGEKWNWQLPVPSALLRAACHHCAGNGWRIAPLPVAAYYDGHIRAARRYAAWLHNGGRIERRRYRREYTLERRRLAARQTARGRGDGG